MIIATPFAAAFLPSADSLLLRQISTRHHRGNTASSRSLLSTVTARHVMSSQPMLEIRCVCVCVDVCVSVSVCVPEFVNFCECVCVCKSSMA